MKNVAFRIEAMDPQVVERLRETRVDDLGNALVRRKDGGRHQCRYCLRLTDPWEEYLAISYAPMPGSHPFVERGPVYVHDRACERYGEVDAYPAEMPRTEIVLRAYGDTNEIEDARLVTGVPPEDVIRELFANPRIRHIHARNGAYGCFMFEILPSRGGASTGA